MIIVLMGVTGSGKTTVGRMLAGDLGWPYADADDFHSPANVAKMASGIPLSDLDRKPWLEELQRLIRTNLDRQRDLVLACSALKEGYRRMLLVDQDVKLVYLKGELPVIEQRLRGRHGHYMDPKLLDSQFETLEEPVDCLKIDITAEPTEIVREIRTKLNI